jgi:hypothetical protein
MEDRELADPTVRPSQGYQQFRSLDKHRDEIRVLCLNRGVESDPITCTTSHAYLDTDPQYEALSYAWGDPNETLSITLNGSPFQATTNLVTALRRLRLEDEDRYLWVDALCINQGDVDEKNSQVPLMRRIYSDTTQGIMWLGDTEDDLTSSPPAESSTGHTLTISESCAAEAFALIAHLASGDHIHANKFVGAVETILDISIAAKSLNMLLDLSWWHRVWTVQEVILPQQVIFQCGDFKIPLDIFDAAVESISDHRKAGCCDLSADDDLRYSNFETVIDGIMMFREDGSRDCKTLIKALNTLSHRLSTNKCDKVYALLGLVSDPTLSLTVDYGLPYTEIFAKTAVQLLRTCKNLSPLLRPGYAESDAALASWVPNWGEGSDIPGTGLWELNFFDDWNAAADCPIMFGNTNEMELSLLGFCVDEIVYCLDKRLRDAEMGFKHITSIFPLPSNYPLGGTYLDVFIQLLEIMKDAEMIETFIFITRHGLLGISSDERVVPGDAVYVLSGGNVPFILRSRLNTQSTKPFCQYVTHSYVHGIMMGELFRMEPTMQWVHLV